MTLSVLLLASLAAEPPSTCTVQGAPRGWIGLSVAVSGAAPFDVTLDGGTATATLPQGQQSTGPAAQRPRARVRVDAPLRFDATVDATAVPLRAPTSESGAFRGMIHFGRGTRLLASVVSGDAAMVTVQGLEDTLPPVEVPCSYLSLGSGSQQAVRIVRTAGSGILPGPDEFDLVGDEIAMYTVPEDPDPYRVHPSTWLWVRQIAKQPGWIRVVATWDDGTELKGWTPSSSVQKPHVIPSGPANPRSSRTACTLSGSATYRQGTLRPGAQVRVAPDGPVWATVASPAQAIVVGASGFVQLVDVQGLSRAPTCTNLNNAFVSADDFIVRQ